MRQHIFKVGWLLSHNSQTSAIFYYSAFLPGIALREVSFWLAAGIFNVRATLSIQLPKRHEIHALQLGIVKLERQIGSLRRACIDFLPLCLALLALWIIASDILAIEAALSLAGAGELDDLARAIAALMSRADFWLWFYIAFTIANTMLSPVAPYWRRKRLMTGLGLSLAAITIALGQSGWRASPLAMAAEELLVSLALLLLLATAINLLMALALGSLEALIEALTGHSATFSDGVMITMTRGEARALRQRSRQSGVPIATQTEPAKSSPVASIASIKLPIPGPPGVEPVSRKLSAVLDLSASKPAPAVTENDRPRQIRQARPSAQPASDAPDLLPIGKRQAFSRPFAPSDLPPIEEDEIKSDDATPGFARPFAPPRPDDAAQGEDES